MSTRHAQQIIGRCRAVVDDAVRRLLAERGELRLCHMIRYHLGYVDAEGGPAVGSGGKGAFQYISST